MSTIVSGVLVVDLRTRPDDGVGFVDPNELSWARRAASRIHHVQPGGTAVVRVDVAFPPPDIVRTLREYCVAAGRVVVEYYGDDGDGQPRWEAAIRGRAG